MKKGNKSHAEEGEGNSERWLLTYSDMITLLLALFIILYSMSTLEAKKFQNIAEQFGSAFHSDGEGTGGGGGGGGGGSGNGTGTGTGDGNGKASGLGTGLGKGVEMNIGKGNVVLPEGSVVYEDPLDEIFSAFSEYVDKNNLNNEISLENTKTYVRIRIQGVLMFYPDSDKLLDSSKPILKSVAAALMKVYDQIDHITISGHTATVGEEEYQNTEFGWTLSVNRANTVRESLMSFGLKEDKLSLEGNGHNVPVSTENTEEGHAKNRRAEITVYKFSSGSEDQNNQQSAAREDSNSG